MPFSSLIFLVIIAVWAAYLVQHWIRRRDHVATARSVDRFSEAMRVLERRQAAEPAKVRVSTPASHTRSVARPAHPEVLVKRAAAPAAAAPTKKRRIASRLSRWKVPVPRVRLTPVRVRAIQLAVGFAILVIGVAMAVAGRIPGWGVVVAFAAFAASVLTVRASVLRHRRSRQRPARQSVRSQQRPVRKARPQVVPQTANERRQANGSLSPVRPPRARRRVTAAPVAAARVRGSAPLYVPPVAVPATATQTSTPEQPATPAAPAPAAASSAGPQVFDLEAVEPSPPAEVPVEQPVAEGTWQPVPVPPPTYTMKAKARRAQPRAAETTPVEELPFDGHALALDEEFEELPAVRMG